MLLHWKKFVIGPACEADAIVFLIFSPLAWSCEVELACPDGPPSLGLFIRLSAIDDDWTLPRD